MSPTPSIGRGAVAEGGMKVLSMLLQPRGGIGWWEGWVDVGVRALSVGRLHGIIARRQGGAAMWFATRELEPGVFFCWNRQWIR